MKRIIMTVMVLVMLAISIGGCWIGWDDGRRGGERGEHERGESHEEHHEHH
jgi:hypothetical protein